MGVRKNGGREEDTRVLSCVLSCARSLLPITFKRVKCSNLLLCIMINSPAPLLSARSLHTALFPLVHYFLYTRGKCVTLKQRSGQFTKLFEGVTRLHPPSTFFSDNPLREKNFVPGHLGEIVAFVLKTKWRFGKCINIKFMISQGRLTFYKDVIFVSQT